MEFYPTVVMFTFREAAMDPEIKKNIWNGRLFARTSVKSPITKPPSMNIIFLSESV